MVNDQLNRDALDEHNRLRALHGCPPLKYDARLAREAQSWTEYLARMKIIKHSMCVGYGENLAYAQSSGKAEMSGIQATQNWYNEIHDHNFNKQYQSHSGHFTQVVWKNTSRAGFGIQKSIDGHHVYIVGRYEPAGNIQGQFQENVPQPTRKQSTPNSRIASSKQDNSINRNSPRKTNPGEITIVRQTDRTDNTGGSNHIKLVYSPERRNSEEPIQTNHKGDVQIYNEIDKRNEKENVRVIRREKKSQRKCAKRCSIM
ncbi:unnamed protein product [Schistosoma turkestanicum]|nr:unnamed protein product [Schistosoma turkestanicum]